MYQKKSYALGSSDHHHHQIEHQLNTSGGHLYHPSHCLDHNHHNQQRHNHIHCHHYYFQHRHHHRPQILHQLDSPSGHLHHPSHLPNCPQPQDLQRNQVMPQREGLTYWVLNMTCRKYVKKKGK